MKANHTPRRIVSLQPSVTAMLDALGLLDRIVGCTKHCPDVAPSLDLTRLSVIEDSWTANATQIAAARPDLVIASVPYGPESIAELLKSGARVVAFSPRSLNDIYGDIRTIAALMDMREAGEQIVNSMRQEIDSVRTQTAEQPQPRVYCEEWGKPMLTSQPWVAELAEAAGGEVICAPATEVTAEQVAAENPDVVVFGWCGVGDRVPAEKLIPERHWENLHAVRNRRVYVIADQFLTTPAPILTVGLRALAHAIHPELFPAVPEFSGKQVMRTPGQASTSKQRCG